MNPPPAFRHEEGEVFDGRTELIFDPIAAAEASAAFTVGEILHPARMARLELYGSMGDYPDLDEVADRLMAVTWGVDDPRDEYRMQVLHATQRAVADQMMRQASLEGNPSEVRAILADRLDRLAAEIEAEASSTPHRRLVAADIRRWQSGIENTVPGPAIQLPAGDPIGGSSRGN